MENVPGSSAPVSTENVSTISENQPQNDAKNESVSNSVETQAQKELRKYKVKIDKQEMEVDEDELVKGYQMSKASMKKMNEAALMRKEAEEIVQMIQQNPKEAIKKLNGDFRKIAEEYLADELRREMMSPEERKMREYEEKLRHYEEMERQQKSEMERQQVEQMTQYHIQEYQKTMVDALSKSDLPNTPDTVSRVAKYLFKAAESNYDLPMDRAIALVKADISKEINSLLGKLDGDTLMKLLGDEISNKIRKSDLSKLKGVPTIKPKSNEQVKQEAEAKKISMDEFVKQFLG